MFVKFGREFQGQSGEVWLQDSADVRAENVQVLGMAGSKFDVVVGGGREHAHSPVARQTQCVEMFWPRLQPPCSAVSG